jgi:hypothetical protein
VGVRLLFLHESGSLALLLWLSVAQIDVVRASILPCYDRCTVSSQHLVRSYPSADCFSSSSGCGESVNWSALLVPMEITLNLEPQMETTPISGVDFGEECISR